MTHVVGFRSGVVGVRARVFDLAFRLAELVAHVADFAARVAASKSLRVTIRSRALNTLTQPVDLYFLTSLWRRWPITIVTTVAAVTFLIASSTHIPLPVSSGPASTSMIALPNNPPEPANALPRTRRSRPQPAPAKHALLSTLRRVPVGENEVDYVGEDVTMRVFGPPAKSPSGGRCSKQVDIGDDVTICYLADSPTGAQPGPASK